MDLYNIYTTLINVGRVAALLSLIIAGIKFVLSMGAPERIKDAKDQVIASLLGLFIITFLPTILHFINPDLPSIPAIFSPPSPLSEVRIPPEKIGATPGVYATIKEYATTKKGEEYIMLSTTREFGPDLNNKIDKITFVDPPGKLYGIVLFDEADYRGSCTELTPDDDAANPDILELVKASSAFIYTYSTTRDPMADKLIFYRKPFRESNDEIGGKYEETATPDFTSYWWLDGIEFKKVPEDEKKCIKWDDNGECSERKTPTLGGDGISSTYIGPDISIIIISEGEREEERGNHYCQLFWNKSRGSYGIPNIKNEYIRANNRYPVGLEVLPGHP